MPMLVFKLRPWTRDLGFTWTTRSSSGVDSVSGGVGNMRSPFPALWVGDMLLTVEGEPAMPDGIPSISMANSLAMCRFHLRSNSEGTGGADDGPGLID